MKKKVNIYPRGPITSVNPPIRVPVKNITKDTKDIRKCIIAGAKVEECTPNGPIELNLQNYDLDNGGNYEAIKTGLKMSLIDENEKAVASGLTATNTAPDTSVAPMQHTFEKPEALQAKIDKIEQDRIARQDIIKKAEEEQKELEKKHANDEKAVAEETVDSETVEISDSVESAEEVKVEEQHLSKKQRKALKRAEAMQKAADTATSYDNFVEEVAVATVDPENV